VRAALFLLALLLVLSAAGAIYQSVAAARNEQAYPAPGQQMEVGGRNLHIYCMGENVDGRPTVILETLSGGISAYWGWVQPDIAAVTRVCSYDRAGRGWSDPASEPLTLQGTTSDLHALLQAAGVPPPYVLAGHSIGGLYARQFAADYPGEVTGVALVDSAHPLQFERNPELLAAMETFSQQLLFFPAVARLGLFQLYFDSGGQMDFGGLPERSFGESTAFLATPKHWRSVAAENDAALQIFRDGQALGDLGVLPLAVISAGQNQPDGWAELQSDLAGLSTNSVHMTVEEAGHASLAFDEGHAMEMSALILAVVEAAHSGQPLAGILASAP
jgi:pimeloyl-ACP methyl ester carboxylesterase